MFASHPIGHADQMNSELMHPARSPYWLHPLFLLICTLGLPALATNYLPEQIFQSEWKSIKYFSPQDARMIAYILAAFGLGVVLTVAGRALVRSSGYGFAAGRGILGFNRVMRIAFWGSTALTLIGSLIWAFFAARQGVSLSDALAALHGDSMAVLSIRDKAETIPGITTLTQFGMAAAVLAGILWFEPRHWRIRITLVVILGVALVRSVLRAERLAFIEVFVPFFISLLPGLLEQYGHKRLLRAALWVTPIVAVAGLSAFFIIAESGRSYQAKVEEGNQHGVVEYGAIRLGGYYSTSLNNGAYLLQHLPRSRFPYFVFDWFWRFPGVKAVLNPHAITGIDGAQVSNLLTADMNIEFNNPSGVFTYEHDFGPVGILAMAFLTGSFSAWLYTRYQDGAAPGRLLYPMLVIGFLEISRIPYLTSGRVFPSLAFLGLLCASSALVRVNRTAGVHPGL